MTHAERIAAAKERVFEKARKWNNAQVVYGGGDCAIESSELMAAVEKFETLLVETCAECRGTGEVLEAAAERACRSLALLRESDTSRDLKDILTDAIMSPRYPLKRRKP